MTRPPLPDTLARLRAAAGPGGWTDDPAQMARHLTAFRDGWQGRAALVLRPADTASVAALVRICAETRTAIVPQGGNTGLTGGGQPHDHGAEVVISTERLTRIRAVDPANDAITVEAGVTAAQVQAAAEAAGRLFPLSWAAEGSAQIGGALSTNAGGVQVLRYGTARALALGLEVVTPRGEIWDGLRALRKDNAGYDLKQLFIGAEGTLGIITAAVLKLVPRPTDGALALAAVPDPQAGIDLLARLKAALGESLSAFELMHPNCFRFAESALGLRDPMPGAGWRVLAKAEAAAPAGAMRAALESALAAALEAGEATDAVLPASEAQAAALWRIREDQAEVQRRIGAGIKHDVSVPVSAIPAFVAAADAALAARWPDHRPFTFGHAGDGNLHYNPVRPEAATDAEWKALTPEINALVHDLALDMGGSITAEHGVGRLRRAEMLRARSPVELALMRRVKAALDPDGIMNPGKLLPDRA